MSQNIIGTTDHLRMAKSILTDLRNRGYEEHASLLYAGDDEKISWLDNIREEDGRHKDQGPYEAGVVELHSLGKVASVGPAYNLIADVATTSEASLAEVCSDMGLPSEGEELIKQWLQEGKYILMVNNVTDSQVNFLKQQLGDLQGLDDLTIC